MKVDRTKAQLVGLTQKDVAYNMLESLAGSVQTSPSFWIDSRTGTSYFVAAQTPQYLLDSTNALVTTPVTNGLGGTEQAVSYTHLDVYKRQGL